MMAEPTRSPSSGRSDAAPVPVGLWVAELARLVPVLVRAHLPVAPLEPRARERVKLAVCEVNGCRYSAWVHEAWQDVLGPTGFAGAPPEEEVAVLDFARACAEAGRPLDPGSLNVMLSPAAVRAIRATVASTELANVVGNAADSLWARLAGRTARSASAMAREAATLTLAAPIALPFLAFGGALRLLDRAAPHLPAVDQPDPDDANLLSHLLVEAAPGYLGHALLRTTVLRLPFTVSVGLRTGRTAATVRLGRGQLAVNNGIDDDAILVVEGDLEPLLRAASGAIVREVGSIRVRPS